MVDRGGLENRCTLWVPWVRIPPPPPVFLINCLIMLIESFYIKFSPSDPPPLNWSDLIVRIMKEARYGEEDIQARGDCFEAASG